ncbi:MAG TPA: RNA polymerase sigma factor [Bryobacteraceae bacterium]|nr:RNA polymerase sigma factor [Bryobacteraceae bacterium]
MCSREITLDMHNEPTRLDETSRWMGVVRRAKAGDAAAFEEILIAHERPVLRLALRLLGSLEDAQDAAQDVFLRLHRHLGRFDEERDLSPWLYTMTVNVCRELGRKRKPHVQLQDVGRESPVESAVVDEERRRLLGVALRGLPRKERAALVLRDLEGHSTKDVAAMLRTSEATVRSQVASARLRLREIVERLTRRRS